MDRLGRLAVSALFLAAAINAVAGERVAVAAGSEELREALTDALEGAGYSVVSSGTSIKELGGRAVKDLLTDEGLFKDVAKKVFDGSGARVLIVATEDAEEGSRNADLGTVQWKSKVVIAGVYGQTGASVGRATDKGQGSSSSEEKAAAKARDQAIQKALPAFVEKLKAGLSDSATKLRKMTVKVTDLPETLYGSAGLKMRKVLEKTAGASDVTPAYDGETKAMTVTFFYEGTASDLEDKLRANTKFIRDFVMTASDDGGLTFKINAQRMMCVIIGHSPDKVKEAGGKVFEALKAHPDTVDEMASYAQGAWEVRFLSSSGAIDLHESLKESLKDDPVGAKLHLNVMGVDGLVYRYGGDRLRVNVKDLGPDSYEETGLALSNLLEQVPGVDGVIREYRGGERLLTLNVFYSGDRTALENALRQTRRDLGELALVESAGDSLTFAFALRSLTFKVRGYQPDIVQKEGRRFLEKARAVSGARSCDWDFASDGDFVVGLLWKGTASQFHAQIEKELKGFQLISARDLEVEYAVGGQAIKVLVKGLADGFYENTSRTLSKALEGLKGTTGLKRSYDASAKSLAFVVFYNGDARQLEDALKGRKDGLGELTVESSRENELVLAFALREVKVTIEGPEPAPLKEIGAALGDGLKKAPGVAEAKWTYDEAAERFDVALLCRMDAPGVHEAALQAIGTLPLAEKLRLISVKESAVAYRLGELTIQGQVQVKNLPPESMGAVAEALMGALKGLDGVKEATKAYAEATKTLTVSVKFTGSSAELDEALWAVVKGRAELEDLAPADAGPGRVAYAWRSGEQAMSVTVANVIPSAYDANAKALKDALELAGVRIEGQTYNEKALEIRVELKTKKRAHQIDEAIRATPGGLLLVDSGPDSLRYEAPPSMDQQAMLELREVDADVMKGPGTEFLQLLKGLPGVAAVDHEYAADRKAVTITVTFKGRPIDLDGAIWAAIAGKATFAGLYPGDLSLGILVYEFRKEAVALPVTVAVNGVRPSSVQEVRAAVAGALEGIAGVKDPSETYDDGTEAFSLSATYEGRPAEFFAAFSRNFNARPDAARFALQRSLGTEMVLRHNAKVDDASEFALQVGGWREKEDASLGDALVKAISGIAGLSKVQGAWRPDIYAFVVTFTTKLKDAEVDDAVRQALAADASLARVRPGSLRDGYLMCGLEPAAGGETATAKPTENRPDLSALVEKVDPGVVFIQTSLKANKDQAWLGSGFLVSSQGHILTNDHVISVTGPDGKRVDQKDVKVKVKLADGRWFAATVLATDPEIDAAVIRIRTADLPALAMGDSDNLRIGQDLFVIGNPLGLEHSVTTGIVSAFGRMGGRIQTNALINHGNSGGPAFSMDGKVVAIAVAGAVANYAFEGTKVEVPQPGINFLIPINQVRSLLEKAGE